MTNSLTFLYDFITGLPAGLFVKISNKCVYECTTVTVIIIVFYLHIVKLLTYMQVTNYVN